MDYNSWRAEMVRNYGLKRTHRAEDISTEGWDVDKPKIHRSIYKAENGTECIFAYNQLINVTRVNGKPQMDSTIDSFQ